MSIKKEKIGIYIQLCLLIGISLTSIGIGFFQTRINDYESKMLVDYNGAINLQSSALLSLINKINIDNLDEFEQDNRGWDQVLNQLYDQYVDKTITASEFKELATRHLNDQYVRLVNEYNTLAVNLKTDILNPPTCMFIDCKKIINILYVIQTIFVFISLLLYFLLLSKLGKRYLTSVENKNKELQKELERLRNSK